MLRAIREIQPSWVVGENVSGLINWDGGLVFEQVQADLEAQGYEVWANVLPAASVNAPHKRDRVWFVANSKSESSGREHEQRQREREFGGCDCKGDVTNTSNQGLQRSEKHRSLREGRQDRNQLFTRCVPSTWKKFPTQPPICDGDDGLSSRLDAITFPKWRTESIKAGGNAIVPQMAYQIFKAINEYEKLIK
jgi:DNA (cytosine-5)-methyltransferase 1